MKKQINNRIILICIGLNFTSNGQISTIQKDSKTEILKLKCEKLERLKSVSKESWN
jgi:hypothetical protein